MHIKGVDIFFLPTMFLQRFIQLVSFHLKTTFVIIKLIFMQFIEALMWEGKVLAAIQKQKHWNFTITLSMAVSGNRFYINEGLQKFLLMSNRKMETANFFPKHYQKYFKPIFCSLLGFLMFDYFWLKNAVSRNIDCILHNKFLHLNTVF